LFYTTEGSLDNGTFKATCLDLYVMDIGTLSYTEFKDTPDILTYRLEHQDILLKEGVYEALIHSHNNMPAYFSKTDENTLIEEGADLNHFLSLIVCNDGHYVARITRKLKTKTKAKAHIVYTKSVEYNTYDNKVVVLNNEEQNEVNKEEERKETIIEYFELNINKTDVKEPFKDIDERINVIKRKKASVYDTSYWGQSFLNKRNEEMFYKQDDEFKQMNIKDETQLNIFHQTQDIKEGEFYQVEQVPDRIIRNLIIPLLYGSIFANDSVNLDLDKFVRRMDEVYEKKFGNLDDDSVCLKISNWISFLIEQLISSSVDKDYENELADKYDLDEYDYNDAFIHLYAYAMISYLYDLPESKIKDIMIDELIKFMS
jgi:hypothetical protein